MSARRLLLFGMGRRFNPNWPLHNLPELQAWYTFDDPAYLRQNHDSTVAVASDGDVIGYCADRSGNARHVSQATEAYRPIWKKGVRKGRAVARFDGDNDWLEYATSSALLRNVSGATLIAVVQTAAPDAVKHVITCLRNSSVSSRVAIIRDPTNRQRLAARRNDWDGAAWVDSSNGVFSATEWGVQTARINYASAYAAIYYNATRLADNATFLTQGTTSDTDSNGLALFHSQVGSLGTAAALPAGDLAEVIVCGADIGEALLQALLTQYLYPKWGVQNHPFESTSL